MGHPFGYVMGYASFVTVALAILLHLLIAFGLNSDALRLRERGIATLFFGPIAWFFVGLGGGFIALAIYWAIHHSTFRARE